MLKYVAHELPVRLNIFFPWAVFGLWSFTQRELYSRRIPYITIYVATTIIYLSAITHKEPKFLLPIFPLLFLMSGYQMQQVAHGKGSLFCGCSRSFVIKALMFFGVFLEIEINYYFVAYHDLGAFAPIEYI